MNELLSIYAPPLNASRLRYMVTGSVAAMFYGEIRLTLDLDLVLELPRKSIGILASVFPEGEYYLPPSEVLEVESCRPSRGHFNIIHQATGMRADIYLHQDDPAQAWGLANSRKRDVDGLEIPFAPPEYVILRKLEYFREGGSKKHLRDIAGILSSLPALPSSDLQRLLQQGGLTELWETHFPDHPI